MNSVTNMNWGQAPHNRWSFQHVQSLFPTARIRRGNGAPSYFESKPINVLGIRYPGIEGGEHSVEHMLTSSYTDAFLVARERVMLAEHYFNGMAPDSHHLLNSVTKSYIGMLTGILIHEGVIEPDQLVSAYIPEFSETAFAATRVRHVLDMSAAVCFGEEYADPDADFWLESAVVGWRPALADRIPGSTLFEFACSLNETEQNDGERYHYRTVLTNVLAMVIERATGLKTQDLLQQRLWSKLRPEQDASIVVDSSGFPYVGAGMNACARDLVRFGQMVVQGGRFDGQQIVPEAWIHDTRYADDHTRQLFKASDYGEGLPNGHYRNQFWVFDSERGVLVAIGIHGQTIYMNMSTGVVIVKLSSQPESVDQEMFGDTFAAMAVVAESV